MYMHIPAPREDLAFFDGRGPLLLPTTVLRLVEESLGGCEGGRMWVVESEGVEDWGLPRAEVIQLEILCAWYNNLYTYMLKLIRNVFG